MMNNVFTSEALQFLAEHSPVPCDSVIQDNWLQSVDFVVEDWSNVVTTLSYAEAGQVLQDLLRQYEEEEFYRDNIEPIFLEFEDYLENHHIIEYLTQDLGLLAEFLNEWQADEVDTFNEHLIGYTYEVVDTYYGHTLTEPYICVEMDVKTFKEWFYRRFTSTEFPF